MKVCVCVFIFQLFLFLTNHSFLFYSSQSTILGGHFLPDDAPAEQDGYMVYPTETDGYVAKAAVRLFGFLIPCVQEFTMGMYCPNATLQDENGGQDSCLVFSAWQATCPGSVLLCGAYNNNNGNDGASSS